MIPFVYLNGGVRGEYCLRALLDHKEPCAALLGPPGSLGEPAALLAARDGITVLAPSNPNAPEVLEQLAALRCELAIMSGYNRILGQSFLDLFPRGVINLHGGPLPGYRGGSPLNWQIIRGEPRVGISILFTGAGIDTGAVLASDSFELGANETIDSTVQRTLPIFARMLLEVLEQMRSGKLQPRPQNPDQARYFAKRLPRDGWIDWRAMAACEVHNLTRALSGSYPGAFTYCAGEKIIIEETRLLAEQIIAPPGRVLARRAEGVEIAAADRALLVRLVRAADGLVHPAREALPPRNTYLDPLPPPEHW